MSEHPEPVTPISDVVRTGDPAVDAVLDQVDALEQVPVEEHVAVFEAAHEALRGALDGRSER